MRTRINFLIFIGIVSAISLTSCSNEEIEGPIGPVGPQGEQGIQGPAGPQGPAGEDGQSPAGQGQDGTQGGGSVDGEQGEQGPQGTQGEQGLQGEPGEDGQDGADGEDGNANVIASDWIKADFGNVPKEESKYTLTISNKDLSKSLVLVYARSIVNLPVFGVNSETTYLLPMETEDDKYWFTLGKILSVLNISQRDLDINVKSIDGSDKLFRSIQEVRYFIVPANLTAKNMTADFQKMTYEEVIAHFGLDY